MDFQHRAGNKAGGGGTLSFSERNVDRRERMRLLAMEISDINKDPYIMRNNIGLYECRLCSSIHNNEGNYLSHTQGKKHQTNLLRRKQKTDSSLHMVQPEVKPKFVKIGKPGYKLTKIKNSQSGNNSILIEIEFPEIRSSIVPKFKILSTHEQKIEPINDKFQFVVIAAEPYENIAFKVPNYAIDFTSDGSFYNTYDDEMKIMKLLLTFTNKKNYT